MPVVLRSKGYRFLYFALDRNEPPHVHVKKDGNEAKFWLEPVVRLARNKGLRAHEVTETQKIIIQNREHLLEAWHAFFRR